MSVCGRSRQPQIARGLLDDASLRLLTGPPVDDLARYHLTGRVPTA